MAMDKDYLQLFNWWLSELNKEEKEVLNTFYRPMGANLDGLEAERVFVRFRDMGYKSSSSSPVNCLVGIADYVPVSNFDLKNKILKKAEEISNHFSYCDKHFLYLSFVKLFKNSENKIQYRFYCSKMVSIADFVKVEMIEDGYKTLPANIAYDGVFEELKEEGKYEEAIKLILDGREKGWNIQYLIDDVWDLVEEKGLDPKEFGLKEESEYYTSEEIENNPYLKINLLMDKIEAKGFKNTPIHKEAEEVILTIEKKGLNNYIVLESLYKIGLAYYKNGEKEKALNTFDKIKISIVGLSSITTANFYGEIGKFLYSNSEMKLAYDWLKLGIEMNPKLKVKSLIKRLENI